jgi:hypothetical protein
MLLRGERPAFSASSSVAFYLGAAHPKGLGGLALWHSSVHGLEDLLPEVFRIGFHAPMMHPAQLHRNPL